MRSKKVLISKYSYLFNMYPASHLQIFIAIYNYLYIELNLSKCCENMLEFNKYTGIIVHKMHTYTYDNKNIKFF